MAATAVGVDVGTNAVRAVEIELGDSPLIQRMGQVGLPVGAVVDGEVADVGAVSIALRQLWSQAGFKSRKVRVGMSSARVIVRTIEMRKAEWTEVDLAAAEWRIPAEKMKMRRLHIVPLSTQAVALLTELKGITGAGRWLFPNHRRPHDVMSATTINHALMGLGFASATVTAHDFRATASTRLHEMGLRSDFIELQLAHVERNRVRAAYNHADHLAERAAMMK